MRAHTTWMGLLAAVSTCWTGVAAGKALETQGRIEQVTIYRGQALVTRVVQVVAPAGTVDLVVTDLPEQTVAGSLYAVGDGNVLIRAVRFRTRAVQEEPRPEVRDIDKKLDDLSRQLREMQAQEALQKQKDQFLGNLEKFSTDKTAKDLDRGVLKVETVVALAEFLFKQRGQLSDEALKRKEKEAELKAAQALLQRQRQKLTSKSSRTAREAILFLEKKAAANATIRLNYLVTGASWSPSYTLRCAVRGQKVDLEYNALVQQMSGEDWSGVTLKLSTASPTMMASAPILTPLWITLTAQSPKGKAGQQTPSQTLSGYLGGQRTYRDNLHKALRGRAVTLKAGNVGDLVDSDWAINVEANRLQIMDLLAERDVILSGQDMAAVSDDVLSVSYDLPGKIGVPSRSDRQMIQIASMKLDARFYDLATPVLTPYVYQQADIANSSNVALLAGTVSMYMNGQFTGTGQIPIVAKGQHFTVGFGVDSQLRVKRELADKTDKVQGGNRVQALKYAVRINNYKDEKVVVRLLDRLPDPRGADIKITLGEMSEPLSKDKLYLQTLRKMGILQWEIDVPPKASGASAKTVEYGFIMEFDRNMRLAEPSAAQVEKEKREFKIQLESMQMMQ